MGRILFFYIGKVKNTIEEIGENIGFEGVQNGHLLSLIPKGVIIWCYGMYLLSIM
jgi:hypothetical protein